MIEMKKFFYWYVALTDENLKTPLINDWNDQQKYRSFLIGQLNWLTRLKTAFDSLMKLINKNKRVFQLTNCLDR